MLTHVAGRDGGVGVGVGVGGSGEKRRRAGGEDGVGQPDTKRARTQAQAEGEVAPAPATATATAADVDADADALDDAPDDLLNLPLVDRRKLLLLEARCLGRATRTASPSPDNPWPRPASSSIGFESRPAVRNDSAVIGLRTPSKVPTSTYADGGAAANAAARKAGTSGKKAAAAARTPAKSATGTPAKPKSTRRTPRAKASAPKSQPSSDSPPSFFAVNADTHASHSSHNASATANPNPNPPHSPCPSNPSQPNSHSLSVSLPTSVSHDPQASGHGRMLLPTLSVDVDLDVDMDLSAPTPATGTAPASATASGTAVRPGHPLPRTFPAPAMAGAPPHGHTFTLPDSPSTPTTPARKRRAGGGRTTMRESGPGGESVVGHGGGLVGVADGGGGRGVGMGMGVGVGVGGRSNAMDQVDDIESDNDGSVEVVVGTPIGGGVRGGGVGSKGAANPAATTATATATAPAQHELVDLTGSQPTQTSLVNVTAAALPASTLTSMSLVPPQPTHLVTTLSTLLPTSASTSTSTSHPRRKSKNFTTQEDTLLLTLHATHGDDWETVARLMGTERTGEQVRQRYRRVMQKRKKDEGGVATAGQAGGPAGGTAGTGTVKDRTSVPSSPAQGDRVTPEPDTPRGTTVPGPVPAQLPAPVGTVPAAPPAPPAPGIPSAPIGGLVTAKPEGQRAIYEYFSRSGGGSGPGGEREREERERAVVQAVREVEEIGAAKLSTLRKRLTDTEAERDDAEALAVRVSKEARERVERVERERKAWGDKCWTVLSESLVAQAKERGREARRKMHEDTLRLASVTMERHGLDYRERWEQGYAFAAVQEQLQRVAREREEVEKRRKTLAKRKAAGNKTTPDGSVAPAEGRKRGSAAADGDALQPISPNEFWEMDEILKLRMGALKKEESDVLAHQERLAAERDRHVRELRRIKDEDASRFRNHPTLNERYLLLELLGRGGFSEVWKGFDREEMRVVAVKIHSLNSQWSDDRKKNYTRHAMREYSIHQRLDHPRIVRLSDVFEIDSESFATVLEYCDGTDLESHLQALKSMPEREARSIVTQVFSALRYLNEISPAVIHYDLKPGNILFHNGEVRITDFGLSKVVEADKDSTAVVEPPTKFQKPAPKWPREIELTSQGAGTIWYLPPECFETTRTGDVPKISSKVDVWSCGVIFYELLYGVKPFGHNQSQQTILRNDSITSEAHSLVFPSKPAVSQETKDFIRKCLEYRKERRPDVLTLCMDSYLNPAARSGGGASGVRSAGATVSNPAALPPLACGMDM